MVKKETRPSKKLRNCAFAFLFGGGLCALAEGVKLSLSGLIRDQEALAPWVTVIMISLGAALTAFGIYDRIAGVAGAGSLIPITGFANAVASPAIEYSREGLVGGTAVGMFSIAGPVIVFGISASIVYGLVIFAFGLY